MQTVGDKTLMSSLRCDASDRYTLLNTIGGVGCVSGDFSPTKELLETE